MAVWKKIMFSFWVPEDVADAIGTTINPLEFIKNMIDGMEQAAKKVISVDDIPVDNIELHIEGNK